MAANRTGKRSSYLAIAQSKNCKSTSVEEGVLVVVWEESCHRRATLDLYKANSLIVQSSLFVHPIAHLRTELTTTR
jgi:hypothetical protein